MKQKLFLIFFTTILCCPSVFWAQQGNIPLHSWRTHFSYQSIYSLALAGERVYAAGDNGLFYYDRDDNSITTLSAREGLSDAGVRHLEYGVESGALLLVYRNGNLDIIESGNVYNIRTILDASLPGDRSVNHVQLLGHLAFLATDYGISVLDLQAKEVKESYFHLGPEGEAAEVFQLAVWNDSLFASTENGFIANALAGANLADFNSWRHFQQADIPNAEPVALAASPGGLFAGVDGLGLLKYTGDGFAPTAFSTSEAFRSLETGPAGILIALQSAGYIYDPVSESSQAIASESIRSPFRIQQDEEGNFWVADGLNGLISNFEGAFRSYIPNGPLADVPVGLVSGPQQVLALFDRLNVHAIGEEAWGGFSIFSGGSWKNFSPRLVPEMPEIEGFSAAVFNKVNNKYYFSSIEEGLLEWDPERGSFRQFKAGEEGVSLGLNEEGLTPVRTLAVDPSGVVWMVQSGTGFALHAFNPEEGSWRGYLENNALAGNAEEIVVLLNGDKWLRLQGVQGVLVFNEEEDKLRILGSGSNSGGLSSRSVSQLEQDLDGQLWLGLDAGVNYFPSPFSVLEDENVNAALPVYEGRALLNTEEVSALAVDGGNRKWIGTPAGLWVFGDYGDTLYHHFTSANSPLPGNLILDLAIEQESGEVFIASGKGMVSFRSGATEAGWKHAEFIKVYPNPVYPGYGGKVGITGLARDVVVKITDISGRLVKELAAEGGTASWDLTDGRGRRPATGVYLIFSSSDDGTETLVGKLAIVN